MRTIDADALKKQIEDFHCKDCDNYNFVRCRACWVDDTISYLDEAPTVGGWISVKDRLPEPPAKCLVYSGEARRPRGMETATYTTLGWIKAAYFPEITHWMPLPEPPKEGEVE